LQTPQYTTFNGPDNFKTQAQLRMTYRFGFVKTALMLLALLDLYLFLENTQALMGTLLQAGIMYLRLQRVIRFKWCGVQTALQFLYTRIL